jgi:hypothetical protein
MTKLREGRGGGRKDIQSAAELLNWEDFRGCLVGLSELARLLAGGGTRKV